jgi:hypothetical protein
MRIWAAIHGLMMMILLFVTVGCKVVGPSVTTEVSDSTYVKEQPRFISVFIPGDSVEVLKYIECDSNTNKPKPFRVEKKQGRASVKIEVKPSGELVTKSNCDSLHKLIQVMDREIFRLRQEKKKIILPEYKTKPVVKALAWVGVLCILSFIAFIFYKLNKHF